MAYYFILLFSSFLAFDILGKAVLGFTQIDLNDKPFKVQFLSLLFGLIISVITFSLIQSSFLTINLGVLMLCLIYIFTGNINFKKEFKWNNYNWKILIFAFFVIIFQFGVTYFIKGPSHKFPFPIYFGDHLFYSEVSEVLNKEGVENTFRIDNLLSSQFLGLTPYHYFDLWLNALISKVFNIPPLFSLELIANTLIRVIGILGILSIFERFGKITFLSYLIAFFSVFISGLYLSIYDNNYVLGYWWHTVYTIYGYPKLAYNFIVLIASLILFDKKNILPSVGLLLCLVIFNIANGPGILGGVCLGSLILYLVSNKKKNLISAIALSVLVLIFIGVFYYFNKSKLDTYAPISIKAFLIEDTFQKIKLLLAQTVSICVFYIPLLFVFVSKSLRLKFLYLLKSAKELMVIIGCILLVGYVFSIFYFKLGDSYQFFDNLFIPVVNIFICIIFHLIADFLINSKQIIRILVSVSLCVFLGASCFFAVKDEFNKQLKRSQFYSISYLSAISSELREVENPIGVGFYLTAKVDKSYLPYYGINNLGPYLPIMRQGFNTVNLSTYEFLQGLGNEPSTYRAMYQSSIFTRFVLSQKKNREFLNVENSQIAFMKENKTKFAIVEKGAVIPKELNVSAKKIIKDIKSGEKFYLF